MKSRTKYNASAAEIEAMFAKAKLGQPIVCEPLGNGEFNAAFKVTTEKGQYVLKVSPPRDAVVMGYENDMMHAEIFWYGQIAENTSVKVPEIYFADESFEIIPCRYFIMELLPGEPLWMHNFTEAEKEIVAKAKVAMAGQIHRIKSDKFGYIQTGLKDTWYEAIRAMIVSLLDDCVKYGEKSVNGERLLQCVDRYQSILEKVEGTMVNFDLWDSNVFCERKKEGLSFAWIDPERSFWGDPIADFVTCGNSPDDYLSSKRFLFETYEQVSGIHLYGSFAENVRYCVALGYLALIMEAERYTRYEPGDEGWERNTVDAAHRFEVAFNLLEHEPVWAKELDEKDAFSFFPSYVGGKYFPLFNKGIFPGAAVGDLTYYLYDPIANGGNPDGKYPLFVFAHGKGNALDGINVINYSMAELYASEEYQKAIGGAYLLVPVANEVITPEGQMVGSWDETYVEPVFELMQKVKADSNGAITKAVMLGTSCGGFFTWTFLNRHVEDMDAVVVAAGGEISPDGILDRAEENGMQILICHGRRDELVPFDYAITPRLEKLLSLQNVTCYFPEWVRNGDGGVASLQYGMQMGQHCINNQMQANLRYDDGTYYAPDILPEGMLGWLRDHLS